ncbi:MAG TPA: glycoside hydrolase family 5 protein [Polyangiaceae bacterium]|nr:glycoside hydrolase family 5 protein [Polyangiaceae bacterium]
MSRVCKNRFQCSLLGAAFLWVVGCGSSSTGANAGSAGAPAASGTSNAGAGGGAFAAAGTGSAVAGSAAGGAGGAIAGHAGEMSGMGGAPTTGGVTHSGGAGGVLAAAGAGAAGSAASECVAKTAVASMKLGWNLGNSLDVADASKSDTAVETAWGNPAITPELLKAVAAAGFGAVRIPVTWIGRFGSAPNYTISPAFIARVEQVVKYALDAGLYVIINVHHDGGNNVTGRWLTLVDGSGQVTSANNTAVLTQFKALWTQIAAHFSGYGEHLVLEAMNEVMVDYNTPKPEYYTQINALNQAFVDTVRASGGNNPKRCLVVPGYNTNIDYTVAGFVLPKDSSAGKLILSDHFYDPYSFAGSAETHTWGTGNPGIDNWGQEDWVKAQMAKLKATYGDKDLPIILGEYGAVNQTGYENYRRYYVEYVTKAAHDAGITPFFWDNGGKNSGSDAFGLIDRSNNAILYPMLMQALTRAVSSSYALADVAKP